MKQPEDKTAMAGPRDYRKRIRTLLVVLAALTVVFLFVNAPQCPEHFTQEQVDASRCVVGANIGRGLYLLLATPVAVVVLTLLGFALHRQYGRSRHPINNEPDSQEEEV